tara:strand:- start:2736 stop:2888 length:153 start_codon:yes stop_codon:yes gene_type:complete
MRFVRLSVKKKNNVLASFWHFGNLFYKSQNYVQERVLRRSFEIGLPALPK